ncbi:hypothetical protein TUMEXPCC7403_24245 [Tumidithrix helvetica PCC 7403]|uniref:response regulator n=1 Tax=Tumidithrix helvetica TaxID=3457545 RepID=UPI003CA78FB9
MSLSNVRILVVEDNPADADLLEEFLSDFQNWQSTSVDRLESAIALVEQQTFDVVLLDLSLPDSHGIETVTRLHSVQTSLPIVVLTGLDDEEIGLKALREGAQDYLVKGTFDDRLLKRVISYSIERSQLQGAMQQTNEYLTTINHELVQATRLKDEFLANMSHELRTPLNAILGMSEGLQEEVFGEINERQQKAIALIERSGRHLLELINDILDVSKIEAGKLELDISAVSVHQLCEASLAFVRQQAIQKSIGLHTDIQENLGIVLCDDRRMKQVLLNLLNNAIKFTATGGSVTLVVKQEVSETNSASGEPTEQLNLSVIDTGIGIAAQDIDKLFKPFVQIDASLNRKYAGTGLGLTLVKQIVELHGGTIAVQSEPGKGSCFTVRIPLLRKLASETISQPLPAYRPPLSPENDLVLIVEDSTAASDQFTRYLHELGMESFIHPRGEGTIEETLRIQPALIILDILLPNQSGWETLAQLKAHPKTKDIPVVVVSVIDERSHGLALGAAEYLVKPITREQLYTVVEKLRHPSVKQTPVLIVVPEPNDSPLILIAEDNQANIDTFSSYLESSGYRVILARNGLEAVNLATVQHPNLILMDIQMPVMDGLEAIRQIRANSQLTSIPIVALTALAMSGDREICLAAGANDYLSKPIKLKHLLGVIQQSLKVYSS